MPGQVPGQVLEKVLGQVPGDCAGSGCWQKGFPHPKLDNCTGQSPSSHQHVFAATISASMPSSTCAQHQPCELLLVLRWSVVGDKCNLISAVPPGEEAEAEATGSRSLKRAAPRKTSPEANRKKTSSMAKAFVNRLQFKG